MRILFTVFIVVISCFTASSDQKWFQGVVVLSSGEVKVGQLQYHPKWEAVTFKEGDAVETFPVGKLSQFRYFDNELEVWRKFFPYDAMKQGFRKAEFYEVVFLGEYQLLRKEKAVEPVPRDRGMLTSSMSASERTVWEQAACYNYFFGHSIDNIVPLADFKNYMKETELFEELNTLADEHRLSWRDNHDIVMMINYLNCRAGEGCLPEFQLSKMVASN